jgi:hypothetical protein
VPSDETRRPAPGDRRPAPAGATVDLPAVLDLVRARTGARSVRVVDGRAGVAVAVSGDPAAADPVDGPAAVARLLREEAIGDAPRVRTARSVHVLRPVDGAPGAFLHLRLTDRSRSDPFVDRAQAVLAERALHVAVRCALDGTVPPPLLRAVPDLPDAPDPAAGPELPAAPALPAAPDLPAAPELPGAARPSPVPRPRAAPESPRPPAGPPPSAAGEQPALAGLAPVADRRTTALGAAALAGLAAALPREPEDPEPIGLDTAGPDTAGPDAAGPDAAGPDAAGPDAAGPDIAGPDTARPDAAPGRARNPGDEPL